MKHAHTNTTNTTKTNTTNTTKTNTTKTNTTNTTNTTKTATPLNPSTAPLPQLPHSLALALRRLPTSLAQPTPCTGRTTAHLITYLYSTSHTTGHTMRVLV
jgi:hypothetical protein